MQLIAILGVISVALIQFQRCSRHSTLTHLESDARWVLVNTDRPTIEGTLIQAGYCSALVIVMVIQSDDTVYHRIPVWHDQVEHQTFSYLHHQLAFATVTPARRTLKAFFSANTTRQY